MVYILVVTMLLPKQSLLRWDLNKLGLTLQSGLILFVNFLNCFKLILLILKVSTWPIKTISYAAVAGSMALNLFIISPLTNFGALFDHVYFVCLGLIAKPALPS